MFEVWLAYLAGLLTLINPCVLPLVPLIVAGAVARHPLGPLAIATGLGAAFTLAGTGVYALTAATGLRPDDISRIAAWSMIGFGLVILIPRVEIGFARLAGGIAAGGARLSGALDGLGLGGEVLAGGLLGLAWSPCIGPTLGAAIGLAAQGEDLGFATMIMAAFSLGAMTVMLALAYGARHVLARRRTALAALAPYARPALGVGVILVGFAIVTGFDQRAEGWVLTHLPTWLADFSVSL